METTEVISKLKGLVECAICLETLINPKSLQCNHSYCKECLDKILQFDEDGCAIIKCPKACTQTTTILNSQTTNDLQIDYIVKDLLDTIREIEGSVALDGRCDMCSNRFVKYCKFCKTFLCDTCKDPHDSIEESFQSVTFNRRKDDLCLFCKQHATDVDFVCCGEYVCMYCLNRSHLKHKHKTLNEVEENLKKEIMEDLEARKGIGDKCEEVIKEMIDAKIELAKVLNKKILNCMAAYANFLKVEADNMKKDFVAVITKHSEDILELDCTEYFKWCLLKKGVEFLLSESESKMRLNTKLAPKISVSVTDGDFRDEHPLGTLQYEIGTDICPINNDVFTSKISLPNIQPSTSVEPLVGMLLAVSDNAEVIVDNGCEIEPFLGQGHIYFKIDNFSQLHSSVESPSIKVRGLQWNVSFLVRNDSYSLFLYCKSKDEKSVSCFCCHQLSIRSSKCNLEKKSGLDEFKLLNGEKDAWGFNAVLSRSDVMNEDNGYISEDAIMIEALIEVDVPIGIHWDSKKQTGYVGIKRHQHSCFINPILQVLFSLTRFRDLIFSVNKEDEICEEDIEIYIRALFLPDSSRKCLNDEVTSTLQSTFLKLQNSYEAISAKKMHNIVKCEEVLKLSDLCNLFLKSIEIHLQFSNSSDIVSELFEIRIGHYAGCGNIHHTYINPNISYGLELVVKKSESLEKSLQTYLRSFSLNSPQCNVNCKVWFQKTTFIYLPPILILYIKDGEVSVNGNPFFPKNLDLSQYISEESKLTNPDPQYSLFSVLVYFGKCYFVYVNPMCNGKWYKFNDDIVSGVSEDEATLMNFHRNVHMLTYIRTSEV